MNDAPHPALLPAGLYDLLPPEAEIEAAVTGRLIGVLASHGYERVKPPLVEFEETLLSGAGSAMASDTFRTMDPISHRMVALRADMTPQIARIAATRLPHRPRPLRLSYAGQVLRVRASQMRPERQIGQVGAELIGAAGPAADVEAIAVAGEALTEVGVPHLSVDITLPTLVPAVAEAFGIAGERWAALRAALDRKDVAAVACLAGEAGELLASLVAAAGLAEPARVALDRLDLPERARIERDRLGAVLDGLDAAIPDVKVTVDPVENRGFEYHTGISFTFFARVDPVRWAAWRAGARRPLRGRRPGRARAGDRVHAVHRHDPAHIAGADAAPPLVRAVRGRSRPRPRAARRGVDHGRGAAARFRLARGGAPARLRPCAGRRRGASRLGAGAGV